MQLDVHFAVKSLNKDKMQDAELMRNEIEILTSLEHPNVIKVHEVYEDSKYIHIVTEL
jgi:serine/threonine protein kinase